jgi:selenocysteine lyase/cysteine desulfurase
MKRRAALKNFGLGLIGAPLLNYSSKQIFSWNESFSLEQTRDEKFWKRFRKSFYPVSKDFINLENGYFGLHPSPVHKAYLNNIAKVNSVGSHYMRNDFFPELEDIVESLETFAGTESGELLITRNATEALNIIIQGLRLKRGDEVLLSRHDYGSMIEIFEMLEQEEGIVLKIVDMPFDPSNDQEIIDAYLTKVTDRTRCALLTHMMHLTGQILPVAKVATVLRDRDVEVVVDAAHSFAHVDYKIPDLRAEFVGANLHKWFSNPLGAGLLYVKKERVKDLRALFADSRLPKEDIRRLGHFGTPATPVVMTIPAALKFNKQIGVPIKEARLRYLNNYWTNQARLIPGVYMNTPKDSLRSCAIASFGIEGYTSSELVKYLYEKFNVFTVGAELEGRQVVRVTPNLYNSTDDLDQLVEGMKSLSFEKK